ncbi:MAG: prepilin-type N-terminal cleavage/methylation domain-containing protein [Patescibacteria group bacterium]
MKNFKKGFTLIELLVVVAIIGILAAVILTSSSMSKNKGVDAGVKANLRNAVAQAEVFYATNAVSSDTYIDVCVNGKVGGVDGIGLQILTAAKSNRLSDYTINGTGTLTTATCNVSATGDAWAAEVPLTTAGQMWCVDSTGKSKQESATIGSGTACD